MSINVKIYRGSKSEDEMKMVVEEYVRKWIFKKGAEYGNGTKS